MTAGKASWSPAEDKELCRLVSEGLNFAEIAGIINRTRRQIEYRWKRLEEGLQSGVEEIKLTAPEFIETLLLPRPPHTILYLVGNLALARQAKSTAGKQIDQLGELVYHAYQRGIGTPLQRRTSSPVSKEYLFLVRAVLDQPQFDFLQAQKQYLANQ